MLERLSVLRKERNWSQQEAADKLGIAKSTYAGYESGYRNPSLNSLLKISDLFSTTVDYLLGVKERQDLIELTSLIKDKSQILSIDWETLTAEELINIITFVRTKRILKEENERNNP